MKRLISVCITLCILGIFYMQAKIMDREVHEKQLQSNRSDEQMVSQIGDNMIEPEEVENEKSVQEKKTIQKETDTNKQFACKKVENGYEVNLYDKDKNVIFSMVYPKDPWIRDVTENILEIGISTGSPSRYVFYFDKKNLRISETYFNAYLLENKYVAYMETNEELIITDIFKEGILYMKIARDFSKTANPSSSIVNIEMSDEENIVLEYLAGDDYMKMSEVLTLFPD